MEINRYSIGEHVKDKRQHHNIVQSLDRLVYGEEKTITVNLESRNGTYPAIRLIKHYDLDLAIEVYKRELKKDSRPLTKKARTKVLEVLMKIRNDN